MESEKYFEGVEKLLEIWFINSDDDNTMTKCDLRNLPRSQWELLLQIAGCRIISYCKNDNIDAYILSESSMFVTERRLILKTCGTTTPLLCLESLLNLVKEYSGFEQVEYVFYSRKNYKRPELQLSPHSSFDDELAYLNGIFSDGKSYCFGDITKDCWYLYTLNRSKLPYVPIECDQTLEVIMTNINPRIMAFFARSQCSSATEATQISGIDKLIPNMTINDALFEPCGYSMNGITKNGNYMTIHITPEPKFSYVSFETNAPESSYADIISRVLKTFQPENFIVTIFANNESIATDTLRELQHSNYMNFNNEWMNNDIQHCQLHNYHLNCGFYSKLRD